MDDDGPAGGRDHLPLKQVPGGIEMKLSGSDHKALRDALTDAFSRDELEELVRYSLDIRLESIVGDKGLEAVAQKVIDYAERREAVDELILDARQFNPRNQALARLATTRALAPDFGAVLEKVIPGQDPLFDPAEFRSSMVDAENRVCQIEIRSIPQGSGFLVGPDLVLTNHHVVSPVIRDAKPGITVRFDYTAQRSAARACGVADEWLVASSPPSPLDERPVEGREPTGDELDYALVRLDATVGSDPVNDIAAGPRGWVSLRQEPVIPSPENDIIIMQHPGGGPRRCAIADFLAVNENSTRMRYRTTTQPGSSGSPCFDLAWRLVGIHHSGEPVSAPTYNEGIPLAAIAASLDRAGILEALS